MSVRVANGSPAGSGVRQTAMQRGCGTLQFAMLGPWLLLVVCAGGGAGRVDTVRFGALFAVHGAPAGAAAGARCGPVREHYGIQRVEATLQALDALNAPSGLLGRAGLRLRAELRDSCWAAATALRQTIDLVRGAIALPAPRTTCPSHSEPAHKESESPLVGVLGPGASAAAVQVQNLLQLFSIPQVSYSATSRELSDRARFSTFFRVVPSDRHQARLLVALLRAHNWTYVHVFYTDESYGQSGMAAFREAAAAGGVCVAREEALPATPAAALVDAALGRMVTHGAGARVALCWCEGRTARAVLAGIARASPAPPLRLVGSDGWADRRDVPAGLERWARHALTVRIRSPYLTHFDVHYHALRPDNNARNPWFREFWEQKFNCSLEAKVAEGSKRCTGNESLAVGYTQEPKLALVVRGVHALARGLAGLRAGRCGASPAPAPAPGLCAAARPFNVSTYRAYLQRVRFVAPDGGTVAFDENGDPPPELSEYDVMSLESDDELSWRYERVGRWRGGRLRLRGGRRAAERRAHGVEAVCSRPCAAGQWARRGEGRARCCWTCVSCGPHGVPRAAPALGCRACAPGWRPDVRRTTCVPAPLEWGDGRGARAVAAAAGAVGFTAVVVCAVVFNKFRNTPVVKSASRELCALLLGCAAVCHLAALASACRPSRWSCALVRLGAPALAGVYAAVVTRTVRVARLVAAAERRPRLLSSHAQVCAWAGLSAPGAVACAASARAWGWAPRELAEGRARRVLQCAGAEPPAAHLVPLSPALVLLIVCVALAVRTRRLPHNFNETRFIGAAAYSTCVTWAAFVPLYLSGAGGAGGEARAAALCACVSLSAGACVALSLGPRLWVCLCRPERNTREHFLTATSIRCHLGRYRAAGGPGGPTHRAACTQTDRPRPDDDAPPSRCSSSSSVCSVASACVRALHASEAAGGCINRILISRILINLFSFIKYLPYLYI